MEYLHYLNYPAFAAALIVALWDIYISKDYQYYATREGNTLWTNEYGFLDVKKSLILLPLGFIPPIILGIFVPDARPWLWIYYAIIAASTGFELQGHLKNRELNRAKQNKTLDRIQADPSRARDYFGDVKVRGDRAFFMQFAWLWESPTDPQRETKLIARILELSRTRAFPK